MVFRSIAQNSREIFPGLLDACWRAPKLPKSWQLFGFDPGLIFGRF